MGAVEWSEVLRNYALVAAAAGGVWIAIWRALAADRQSRAQAEQARQSRREHVAEMFLRTVGELDHAKLHVRLGAVYALREIVATDPELANTAQDLLRNYLSTLDYASDDAPPDVQAIMEIVV